MENVSRQSGEHGITGAYKAMASGCPKRAAFLLWGWASLVALGAIGLCAFVELIVSHW